MATFIADRPVDFADLYALLVLTDYYGSATPDPSGYTRASPTYRVTLSGFGFEYDSNDFPWGGTIQSISTASLSHDSSFTHHFTIGGLNLDHNVFYDYLEEHGTSGLTSLFFASDDQITGSNFADTLFGHDGADLISGRGGSDVIDGGGDNDHLDGGTGSDALHGGPGDDTFIVDDAGDLAIELADAGTDIVSSAVSFILGANVENLTLVGAEAIDGTGNELANIIVGNGAANRLDGAAGTDAMTGGLGDDVYVVDNGGDQAIEGDGGGTDLVLSSASFTFGAAVENLILTGVTPINGIGNALANLITGNIAANILIGDAGADLLDGGAGDDTMLGGSGNDVCMVDSVGDVVTEEPGRGNDTVLSSVAFALGANVENLTLTGLAGALGKASPTGLNGAGNTLANLIVGSAGANILDGGAGSDIVAGGLGKDVLTGGKGKDGFLFAAALKGNVDKLADFSTTDDTIRLDDAIFAGLKAGKLAGSAFFTGAAAYDASDRIIYNDATGALAYDLNGNAAGGMVKFAVLAKHLDLSHQDFLVV